jgi:hypothetical protein
VDQRFEVKRGVEPGAKAAALRTRGKACLSQFCMFSGADVVGWRISERNGTIAADQGEEVHSGGGFFLFVNKPRINCEVWLRCSLNL